MKRHNKKRMTKREFSKSEESNKNTLDILVSEYITVFQIGAVELEGCNTLHEYTLQIIRIK